MGGWEEEGMGRINDSEKMGEGRGKINVENETMSGRGRKHSAKRKTLNTNI
jgi:hypothetical protein